MVQLIVQQGAHKGVNWTLAQGVNRLGRSEECDIVIPGDNAVSRLQCEIICEGDTLTFRQISDRSLSLVNGSVVKESPLRSGDTITVGLTSLLVSVGSTEAKETFAQPESGRKTARILGDTAAVFLEATPDESQFKHPIKSLRDLIALFQLSYSFNETTDLATLERHVCRAIKERLDPVAAWIARFHEGSDEPSALWSLGPAADTLYESSIALLRGTINQNQSILIPETIETEDGSQLRTLMLAPLYAGGAVIGGIAVVSESPHRVYEEPDLQFLAALARSLASCMVSAEYRERLELENQRLRAGEPLAGRLLGTSRAMSNVRSQLRQAAKSPLSVLILGETGTGKELAARSIHDQSTNREGPYVPVNCAAISPNLVESELFGYEKGAFTGADRRHTGLIEQANEGTLFLDEIGDLSLDNQARVLRVLEDGTFRRVGGRKEIQSKFRLVAATNKDIPSLVRGGQFREDLYHRINGFEVRIPPLRDRPSDISVLAQHFFELARDHAPRKLHGIDAEGLSHLSSMQLPGNARELKNIIDRAVHTSQGEELISQDFGHLGTAAPSSDDTPMMKIEDVEKRHIEYVLGVLNKDTNEAAKALGVSRSTLYYKIKKFGIQL